MMEHLNMQSMDKVAANVAKIRELFPNCVTERINNEGKLEHAIDFDMLKQELSDHVVDGLQERYQFTWPDKRKAILAANAPINKTLRPCREESVDFDNTENLYIEGDNLEVLKLLQETYLGKVKMIYIDPPYNTGNDFVYEDDFKQSADEYIDNSGQLDEEGNRLVANTESNGRFHTDWLNMMYPRLNLAKDLLSEDGVIAISIDENEVENLKRCCKEIYGESNYIATIISKMNPRGSQSSKDIAITHEYILVIAKSKEYQVNGLELTEEQEKEYKYQDAMGCYRLLGLRKRGADSRREDSPSMYFPIYYDPDNDNLSTIEKYSVIIYPKLSDGTDGRWRWSKSKVEREKNLLVVRAVKRGTEYEYDVFSKDYLSENKRRKPMSIWDDKEINNEFATELLTDLFKEKKIFDYSKSLFLLKKLITVLSSADSLVLDFFSGSATTAHAVMQLNAEDGGKRKFIMVQLQEECVENSEAYKAGYKNICEIGKERIRRAGDKIKAEHPDADLDIGFRVFRVDSSNMKDVYYHPEELDQQSMFNLVSNIKEDRSDLDLLYACLLDWGVEISLPHTAEAVDGCTVHNVDNGALMACFNERVPASVVEHMAKQQPLRAVFRDSAFATDADKINVTEIFKNLSPDTKVKVI